MLKKHEPIVQLEGHVDCENCPVSHICCHQNVWLCRKLGETEGAIIAVERIPDVNKLIERMNKLIKKCPLVILLDEKDCKVSFIVETP